jgi:hypothetical protein
MKKYIILSACILFCVRRTIAQEDNRSAAIDALTRLAAQYMQTPLLSFDVLYRYSSESSPGVYLDSLRGSYKMDSARYWCLLDSTEMLNTGKFVVILYREDKLMYLTLPSAGMASANPLAMADSFFTKKEGLQYGIMHTGSQTRVTIQFDKGSAYKSLVYDIDDKTGLLMRMTSVVQSDRLYDPSVRQRVTPGDSYAVVETLFSNYRQKKFDAGVFDTGRYFKKEAGDYKSIAPYDQYKIFLGKTSL